MIAVAIARFQTVFRLDFDQVSWIISTYYLASAIAQPVLGKLADRFGHKRVFLAGLVLVGLSSGLAPFAPGFFWLLAFRVIQSIGTSAIYPSGMGIVRALIRDRQAQALAVLSIFNQTSAAFGPTLGGLLISWHDWPALFLVNFPLLLAGFCLALWVLPGEVPRQGQSASPAAGHGGFRAWREIWTDIDGLGIVWFSLTILGGLAFLLSLRLHPLWPALALAVAALVLFVWRELRAPQPFVDLRLFVHTPALSYVHGVTILVNLYFYAVFFAVPTYLQEVRHFDERVTGLWMLAMAVSGIVVSPPAGRWIDRSGPRPPLLLSGLIAVTGALLMTTFHPASPSWWVVTVLFILGMGNGFNGVALQTALLLTAPRNVMGTASGLYMTSRYLGTIGSSLLLGVVFGAAPSTGKLQLLACILGVCAALALAFSMRLPKGKMESL
ncbi:MAG: MFS transporter [Alicyclobacillus sp.]|nr:MFS transporter [Alicyclobacillus sp.]